MRRTGALAIFLFLLTACSAGDTVTDEPAASDGVAAETSPEAGDDTAGDDTAGDEAEQPAEDAAAEAPGEFGTFTVNGQQFPVVMVIRCAPFRDGPENLDLQAMGQGPQLNVVVDGGAAEVSVQGSGIVEDSGIAAFGVSDDEVTADFSGDRVAGSGTLSDARGSGDTVEITFDVVVPDTINDC